jgi:arylsulfatase A-like enzyme
LPDSTVAEVLGERGRNTYMVGNWHLCPEEQENLASVALIETAFP